MVSETTVRDYLGIDYADEMVSNNIKRMIKTADSYLRGAIGNTYYDENDPRAVELMLIVIADLYDNRDLSDKVSGNVRRFVNDSIMQLRLECDAKYNAHYGGVK